MHTLASQPYFYNNIYLFPCQQPCGLVIKTTLTKGLVKNTPSLVITCIIFLNIKFFVQCQLTLSFDQQTNFIFMFRQKDNDPYIRTLCVCT